MGSTKTSSRPPQSRPVDPVASSVSLNSSLRGVSVSITSIAAATTSASTQPPPTEPEKEPDSRTSSRIVSLPGVLPVVETTVHRAPRSPRARISAISSKMSITEGSYGPGTAPSPGRATPRSRREPIRAGERGGWPVSGTGGVRPPSGAAGTPAGCVSSYRRTPPPPDPVPHERPPPRSGSPRRLGHRVRRVPRACRRPRPAAEPDRPGRRQARPGVVSIRTNEIVNVPRYYNWFDYESVPTEREGALGTGVIFDPQGFVITNAHVIARATRIFLTIGDGTASPVEREGKLVAVDLDNDLAIVRLLPPEGATQAPIYPYLALGRSDDLMIGETVVAIGNPVPARDHRHDGRRLGDPAQHQAAQGRGDGVQGLHPDRRRDQPGQLGRADRRHQRAAGSESTRRSSIARSAPRASASRFPPNASAR